MAREKIFGPINMIAVSPCHLIIIHTMGKISVFHSGIFEIDWYDTGLGVVAKSEVNARLVEASNLTLGDLEDRDFCITIFNNPEGERILLYQLLNSYKPIKGYGRPFGNWFATNESYREKITKLTNFRFNLCLENSYHPGYYTEKCFHAKLAQVCPIYKADPYVSTDFNPKSFVNLYNF